jgi:hypothetical protein
MNDNNLVEAVHCKDEALISECGIVYPLIPCSWVSAAEQFSGRIKWSPAFQLQWLSELYAPRERGRPWPT